MSCSTQQTIGAGTNPYGPFDTAGWCWDHAWWFCCSISACFNDHPTATLLLSMSQRSPLLNCTAKHDSPLKIFQLFFMLPPCSAPQTRSFPTWKLLRRPLKLEEFWSSQGNKLGPLTDLPTSSIHLLHAFFHFRHLALKPCLQTSLCGILRNTATEMKTFSPNDRKSSTLNNGHIIYHHHGLTMPKRHKNLAHSLPWPISIHFPHVLDLFHNLLLARNLLPYLCHPYGLESTFHWGSYVRSTREPRGLMKALIQLSSWLWINLVQHRDPQLSPRIHIVKNEDPNDPKTPSWSLEVLITNSTHEF